MSDANDRGADGSAAMRDAEHRIARALAQLGAEHEPPAGWEGRVLAAIEAAPERRRWWFAIPLAALVVAAVLVVLHLAPRPDALALVVERRPSATRLRGDTPATDRLIVAHGDAIRAIARGGGRYHAIWVYRDGTDLVAWCPGDKACSRGGGALTIELTLPIVGTYQVTAWSSDVELPAPGGAYDADFAAATAAKATSKLQVVEVQ